MAKRPVIIKITGPAGQRREIPRGSIQSVTFDDEQDGGFTGANIETNVDIDGLPTVANGDTLTVFYLINNVYELRYFGTIVRRAISQEDGVSLTLTAEGESSAVGRIMLNRQFLIPGPPDIAVLWRAIAEEAQLKRPDLFIQNAFLGIFKSQYEAFYKNFATANRDIIQAAGNRAGWGVRRIPLTPYTPILSLDRMAQPTDAVPTARTITLPNRSVSSSDGEDDATDIRNILYIKGGVPINPNVVPNADFRLIEFAGDSFRDLLINGSFDNNGFSGGIAHWTLSGGASRKSTGLTEGPAHSGEFMIELDNVGEAADHSRGSDVTPYIIPGHTYRIQVWARRESGSGTAKFKITFLWRNAALSTVETVEQEFTVTDAAWNLYYIDSLCPATSENFFIKFEATTPSIVIDDASLWDASLVLPRFHEARRFGSAQIVTANFVQSVVRHPFRSAYAPEFCIVSADTDGQDAHFGTRNQQDGGELVVFDVVANASYRVMIDVISPKTPTGLYYKNGKLLIEVVWYNGDGGYISTSKYTIAAGSGFTVWNQIATTVTAPSSAAKAEFHITFRGPATYSGGELTALGVGSGENSLSRLIVGGFCMRLAGSQPEEVASKYIGLPALPSLQYEWLPDGPYQTVFKCTDVMTVGSPEYLSLDTYGEHPDYVEEDSITTQGEAVFFSQATFYAYAVGKPNGIITLEGDTRQFKATEGIRLRGRRGRSLSSLLVPIRKASYKYDGFFNTTLTWGIDKDDPYALLTSIFEKSKKSGGAGAGGGYYGSSGPTSGGFTGTPVFNPTFWGTGPYSSTDPTLHDAYRPAGGVHILTAERTAWNATTAEVIAARTSAFFGMTFADLNARLDAIETGGGSGLPGGAVTIEYLFDSTTTNSDPGSGKFRLNNATQNAATAIYTDLLDTLGSDYTAVLDSLDSSTSTVKGHIRLVKVSDPTKWIIAALTARVSHTGYREFTLTPVSASGASPFTNGDTVLFFFTETGDVGTTGSAGTAGSVWYVGAGVPSGGTGVDGDLYLRTSNSDVYQKATGTWSVVANIGGAAGAAGAAGQDAFTTTSATYTQPAVSSTVTVTMVSTAWLAAGMVVYIATGGYYSVSSITDATHAVLTNLGYTGNAAPASSITSPKAVSAGGVVGATGATGPASNISRTTITITTASLATGAVEVGTFNLQGNKSTILRVQTNRDCRFKVHGSAAQRTADLARVATTRFTPGTGVYADFLMQTAYSTTDIYVSPPNVVVNCDTSPAATGYYYIQNLGATGTVTVTITLEVGEEL